MTESGIRLSADSDCNEERAAAAGQIMALILTFFLLKIPKGNSTFLLSDYLTISSVTHSNSQYL